MTTLMILLGLVHSILTYLLGRNGTVATHHFLGGHVRSLAVEDYLRNIARRCSLRRDPFSPPHVWFLGST